MYGNDECPSEFFCNSSQLIYSILDSREICHMIPEFSNFVPASLENTDRQIEMEDGHHVTAGGKGKA